MGQEFSLLGRTPGVVFGATTTDSSTKEDGEDVIHTTPARIHLSHEYIIAAPAWEYARVLPYDVATPYPNRSDEYLSALMQAARRGGHVNDVKLTGTPRHQCYVDRLLPGEMTPHDRNNSPTNATVWDVKYSRRNVDEPPRVKQELARRIMGVDHIAAVSYTHLTLPTKA